MISHDYRCIFVHIPKTAGNSINRVFGVGWEDHKDLQRYFDELPRDVFTAYFKFAIVRNPWDRLLSDYNYQLKKSREPASKLFVYAADGSKRNFAAWVETALTAPDCYEASDWGGTVSPQIHRWSPQVDWISVDGEVRTDFVARLEQLPEDFRAVRHRLDLPPVRLPHRNRRLHWHYSHYYDRATRELVAAYYARDIAHFGYEFEHAFLRLAVNWPGARRASDPEFAPQADGASDPGFLDTDRVHANDTACHVSFATARPPSRRRIWQRHPGLTAAASFILALGIFGVSSPAGSRSADATVLPPAVRRFLERTATSSSENLTGNIFQRARHFSRTMSELNLTLEVQPSAAPGAILMLAPEPMDGSHNYAPVTAPVVSRSGGSPVPRWWLRRNRYDQD